jgi:hypothetical protein
MPSLVPSWRGRFFEIRPWFFAGNIALSSLFLVFRVFSSEPLVAPVPAGIVLLAALSAIGILTKNSGIHAVLVVSALTIQILGLGAAMFQAGSAG